VDADFFLRQRRRGEGVYLSDPLLSFKPSKRPTLDLPLAGNCDDNVIKGPAENKI